MKPAIRFAATFAAICVALYGMAAFVAWEPNPAQWTEGGRAALAYFCLALGLPAAMATFALDGD